VRASHALLILLAVSALLFFGRLGSTRLWDIDETNNARAAVEMMERGDLVVPTVNGELRTDKPPLHYWFMIAAYRAFGVGEFSARFFAAVFAVGTVLLVGAAGAAWYGPLPGLMGGLALATSLLFSFSSRSATTDSFLVFFVAAAVLAGFAARPEKGSGPGSAARRSSLLFPVLAWMAAGFAVLAKGPVGLLVPAGTLLLTALLLGEGSLRKGGWLRTLFSPPGIALFLLLVLPWYAAAAARTGGALTGGFLLKHNVGRFLSPMQSHRGPFFYYLPVLLLGFFPYAAVLPQAVAAALRPAAAARPPVQGPRSKVQGGNPFNRILARVRECDPRGVLLVTWAALVVGLFSFSGTKLPTYILSAFPALALLMGALAASLGKGARPRGMAWSWGVALALALALPAAAWMGLARVAPGHEPAALLLGVGPLLAAGLPLLAHLKRTPAGGSGWANKERSGTEPLVLAAIGAGVSVLLLHQAVAPGWGSNPGLGGLRTAPRLGRVVAATAAPGERAAAYRWFRPSLVFYAGRRVERPPDEAALREFLAGPGRRFLFLSFEELERLPLDIKGRLMPLFAGPDFPDSPRTVLVAVNGWRRGPGGEP